MSNKPIFVATHPRACSTAFERVFMTRRDVLQCVHEPFGDAYYFGPERLAGRYEHDENARKASGFSESTYKTIMDRINRENTEGKRILIKDMAQYFIPSESKPVSIAPSLLSKRKGVGTTSTDEAATVNGDTGSHFASQVPIAADKAVTVQGSPYSTPAEKGNPTVVPADLLKQFHFAFLIRHPRNGIPSYYRCCIPPLDDTTGFYGFRNDEAGYLELRQLFDYLRSIDVIGPNFATPPGSPTNDEFATNGHVNGNVHANTNGHAHGNGYTNGNGHANKTGNNICVIDADDLLDMPQEAIQSFCESVGIEYHPDMLNWETEEEHEHARDAFEKWKGFHDDAIDSKDLKPRQHKRTKSDEQYYDEWVEKYGKDGAEIIKKAVDENVEHYEYLRQFCVKF